MPPLADAGDLADRAIRLRHKAIHQRGLPDAGVAEQHRHLVDQAAAQRRRADRRGPRSRWSGRDRRTARRTAQAARGRSWSGTESASARLRRRRSACVRRGRCAAAGRRARPRSAAGRRWRRRRARWDRCRPRCAATPFGGHRAARCAPGCPVRPDRSPTRPTSSPTTIEVRPNSLARMAVTTRSGSRPSAQPHRPRSTVTTMPSWASAWSGRVLVRGREPRPGRIRTSDSS